MAKYELALDLFERPHLAGGVKERNIPFCIGPRGRRFVQQVRAGGFPKVFVGSIW